MGKQLYRDPQIRIETGSPSGCHDLWIGKKCYLLQDGVLKEISRTPRNSIRGVLDTYNGLISRQLEKMDMTPQDLGVAVAQARIEEIEEEKDCLSRDLVRGSGRHDVGG